MTSINSRATPRVPDPHARRTGQGAGLGGAARPRPTDLWRRARGGGHRVELSGAPGDGPLLPIRLVRLGPGEGAGRDGGEDLPVGEDLKTRQGARAEDGS